jgi:hypothetical protein
MSFEENGQIQQRLRQDAALQQHQWDQQPSQASVAIQERVDGFKLVVGHRELDEQRHSSFVEEGFEVAQRIVHGVNGGRHKRRVGRRGSADPILAAAKLAWCGIAAAYASQQLCMNFSQESQAQWKLLGQSGDAMLERSHVVAHLAHVFPR